MSQSSALYPKRSVTLAAAVLSVLSQCSTTSAEKSSQRVFNECVDLKMTGEACLTFIQSSLGGDYSNHEVEGLRVKIQVPRTTTVLAESYFDVGIPTNAFGEVQCDINNGYVRFPRMWEALSNEFVEIPSVNCAGLSVNQCCDKFLTAVDDESIPRTDVHGNCLSCWVRQELLAPLMDANGQTKYLDHRWLNGECRVYEISKRQINEVDAATQAALEGILVKIEEIRDPNSQMGVCDELLELQRDLRFFARGNPLAMQSVSKMLCGYCNEPLGYDVLPEPLDAVLEDIALKIGNETLAPRSGTNRIIIYTDRNGFVTEPPNLGGNRANFDGNLDEFMETRYTPPSDYMTRVAVGDDPADQVAVDRSAGGETGSEPVAEDGGVICDATACPDGTFKTQDCHCSDDLSEVCPAGTNAQSYPPACVDCACGFCQSPSKMHSPCCTANPVSGTCMPQSNRENICNFSVGYFPGYADQEYDSCSGVDFGPPGVPTGCGCVPTRNNRCAYDPSARDPDEMCYVCNSDDLVDNAGPDEKCHDCKTCLEDYCWSTWGNSNTMPQCRNDMFSATDVTAREWNVCFRESQDLYNTQDCTLKCATRCYRENAI
jgi:hypothetical protein